MTRILVLLSALALAAPALSQNPPAPGAQGKDAEKPIPPPVVSVTRHSGIFGGQRIAYTATAGKALLRLGTVLRALDDRFPL